MLIRIFILLSAASTIAFVILQAREPGSLAARSASYLMTFAILMAVGFKFGSIALQTRERPLRLVWRWISIAAFVWSLSAVLEFFESRLGQPSFGTIADSFWATGYLFVLVAMIKALRVIPGWKSLPSLILCGAWLVISTVIFVLMVLPLIFIAERSVLVVIGLFFYWFDVLLVAAGILTSTAKPNPAPAAFRFLLGTFLILYMCYMAITIFFLEVTPAAIWINLVFAAAYWMMYFSGKSMPDHSIRHDSPLM